MIFSFFLQELKDENGRVYKLLSERDFELRHLKKKREEEKAALASKIVCLQADIQVSNYTVFQSRVGHGAMTHFF